MTQSLAQANTTFLLISLRGEIKRKVSNDTDIERKKEIKSLVKREEAVEPTVVTEQLNVLREFLLSRK